MNKRIIIIDDDESIKSDYEEILLEEKVDEQLQEISDFVDSGSEQNKEPKMNYELDFAKQGEEGFEMIKKSLKEDNPYSLAFIDMRMPPGWNGLKTSKKIREIDKEIEIVIVTAYADVPRSKIVSEIGQPNKLLYLKKPFATEEIEQLALNLTQKYDLMKKNKSFNRGLKKLIKNLRSTKGNIYTNYNRILKNVLTHVLDYVGAKKGLVALINNNNIDKLMQIGQLNKDDEATIKSFIDGIEKHIFKKRFIFKDDFIIFPLKSKNDFKKEVFIFAIHVRKEIIENKKILEILTETAQDIYENFLLQRNYIEKEKLASIGIGADKIIHDLKNPLSVISGYMQLIEQKAKEIKSDSHKTAIADYVSKILKTEDYMLKTIKGILEFSRGEVDIEQKEIKAKKVIKEFIDDIKIILKKKDIKINIEIEKDIKINIDKEKFKTAFINFFSYILQLFKHQNIKNKNIEFIGKKENTNFTLVIKHEIKNKEFYLKSRTIDFDKKDYLERSPLSLNIIKNIIKKHGGVIETEYNDNEMRYFIKLPIAT